MDFIAFQSLKSCVGTSLLAGHFCARAKALGRRVVAVSFDPCRDLAKWARPLGITCLDGLAGEDDWSDSDLVVIDVSARVEKNPVDVDLTVIPVDASLSVHAAMNLSDRLSEEVVWLENHPHADHVLRRIDLPPYMDHVRVLGDLRGVPHSRAIRQAALEHRVVWSDAAGAASPGGRRLRAAVDHLLDTLAQIRAERPLLDPVQPGPSEPPQPEWHA